MMKNTRKTRLTHYILTALAAGAFGITPVAWALPVQDTGHTNTAGTAITTNGSTMGVSGTAANNVMNWQSFSIAKGETVAFNDNHNYLNLVRGASQSEINGVLSGGGTIYLINPNGILFGATAQVNVGNLVASTRAIAEVGADSFAASGANPLASSASAAAGDIVNLGKLQTASVTLEGNNITIRNAADLTSNGTTALTGAVIVKAAGTIAVGHEIATANRTFKINGVDTVKTVHDYAHANVSSGYTTSKLNGSSVNAVKESMLVENVYDLQNMDAKLGGSYMLAGSIDASETSKWNGGAGFSPVGPGNANGFNGSFDGLNCTITGLYINRSGTDYVGLMGCVSGGTLQNIGMVSGSITGANYVGGVVGYNYGGKITNAYNTGTVSGKQNVGGVVGNNYGSTVENVYNTGAVSSTGSLSYVGGVVGYNYGGKITNVYNTGAVSSTGSFFYVGGVAGFNYDGAVENVYNTGAVSSTGSSSYVGGVVGFNGMGGTVTNAWYATTNAAGQTINTGNTIGTSATLAVLQSKSLSDYGFDTTAWRTNATEGSTALVATTPMLQAFINKASDAAIAHTAVQYGTAETPLINIYQTAGDVTIDYASLSLPDNAGVYILDHNLTVNNFAPGAGNRSSWRSGAGLILKNSSGFTVNSSMTLQGTSITLTTGDSAAGTIIDYGQNITSKLNITANDIVLDTDRVNPADGGSTAVTLTAAGTAKAGYTPTGTMTATVNGATVQVPDYAAGTRNASPTLEKGGSAAISEGMWIKNVTELQAMGTSAATLSKTYFLYSDIDASATKTWNQDTTTSVYQGFVPVGNYSTKFGGTFDGLNHTINGLTINRPTTNYVGLMGYVSGGTIQNIGLVGGSITGWNHVGSVVGYNDNKGKVTNVYNTGTVRGTGNVGGVVGWNNGSGSTVENAYNTGVVSGTSSNVGGVAGYNYGSTVENAYNTGTVSGMSNVGGVAGYNQSSTVENVYNTGAVSGMSNVGGVAGYSDNGTVKNAYNTGAVSGTSKVGGVAGHNDNGSTITNVYNTGAVSGTSNVGGVAGYNYGGSTVKNALWAPVQGYNIATQAVGNTTDTDATVQGVTLAAMKKAETYSGWGNVAAVGGAGQTWRIYEGYTTPLLTSFFKGVVKVTGLSSQQLTYNGAVQAADLSGAGYSSAAVDTGHIFAGSGRNAGTYGAVYSDQQGYDLVNANTLTITPKTLTAALTGDNVFSKVYDGTTAVSQGLGTNYTLAGVADGDQVRLMAGSGVYADKNAGDNKGVTFQGLALAGTDAGNYTIDTTLSGSAGQITRRTITGSLDSNYSFTKVYDGTTAAALGSGYILNGAVAGDQVRLTAARGVYDSSAVGDRTVTFSGFSINDGNYLLSMADSLTGTGRIAAGGQDRNYNDALTGMGSFSGGSPAGGYTIFRGTPEDYMTRAVSRTDSPGDPASAAQATLTWYSRPVSIMIVNGGITLPKDILLGSTPDTRTVVIQGSDSYRI